MDSVATVSAFFPCNQYIHMQMAMFPYKADISLIDPAVLQRQVELDMHFILPSFTFFVYRGSSSHSSSLRMPVKRAPWRKFHRNNHTIVICIQCARTTHAKSHCVTIFAHFNNPGVWRTVSGFFSHFHPFRCKPQEIFYGCMSKRNLFGFRTISTFSWDSWHLCKLTANYTLFAHKQ